jgi:hypothetical protein
LAKIEGMRVIMERSNRVLSEESFMGDEHADFLFILVNKINK